jgi:hypothetical protein
MVVNEVVNELNRGLGKFTHEHYGAKCWPGVVEDNDHSFARDNKTFARYTTVHELKNSHCFRTLTRHVVALVCRITPVFPSPRKVPLVSPQENSSLSFPLICLSNLSRTVIR